MTAVNFVHHHIHLKCVRRRSFHNQYRQQEWLQRLIKILMYIWACGYCTKIGLKKCEPVLYFIFATGLLHQDTLVQLMTVKLLDLITLLAQCNPPPLQQWRSVLPTLLKGRLWFNKSLEVIRWCWAPIWISVLNLQWRDSQLECCLFTAVMCRLWSFQALVTPSGSREDTVTDVCMST